MVKHAAAHVPGSIRPQARTIIGATTRFLDASRCGSIALQHRVRQRSHQPGDGSRFDHALRTQNTTLWRARDAWLAGLQIEIDTSALTFILQVDLFGTAIEPKRKSRRATHGRGFGRA